MIGPQDSAGRFFWRGVVFGSGDCPNTHLVLERPKVGAELFGWRYENRSRHGFALAPDAELRPSLGQCSNANPCVIKNHASSVFDRAIARQPDGIACLVWDVKAEWREWRLRFVATPSAQLRAKPKAQWGFRWLPMRVSLAGRNQDCTGRWELEKISPAGTRRK